MIWGMELAFGVGKANMIYNESITFQELMDKLEAKKAKFLGTSIFVFPQSEKKLTRQEEDELVSIVLFLADKISRRDKTY